MSQSLLWPLARKNDINDILLTQSISLDMVNFIKMRSRKKKNNKIHSLLSNLCQNENIKNVLVLNKSSTKKATKNLLFPRYLFTNIMDICSEKLCTLSFYSFLPTKMDSYCFRALIKEGTSMKEVNIYHKEAQSHFITGNERFRFIDMMGAASSLKMNFFLNNELFLDEEEFYYLYRLKLCYNQLEYLFHTNVVHFEYSSQTFIWKLEHLLMTQLFRVKNLDHVHNFNERVSKEHEEGTWHRYLVDEFKRVISGNKANHLKRIF